MVSGLVVEIGDESSAHLLQGWSFDLSDAAFSSEEENEATRDESNTMNDEVESHSSQQRRNLLAKLKSNLRKRRNKRLKNRPKESSMDMSRRVMLVRSVSSPPDLGYLDTESLLSDDDFSLSHNKHGNFGDVFRHSGDDATRDGPAVSSPVMSSSWCKSFNETLSTVSSGLTNSSAGSQSKRRESLLKHWKLSMRKSLRKVVGLETEWELEHRRQQIKHVKLRDTGGLETIETNDLYVYPEYPLRLPPSKRRNKSVFKRLRVPSLSDDEVADETSTDAKYTVDFVLDSENHVDLDQHGLASASSSNLSSSQRNVYVSFDKDCAQLVLTTEDSFDDSEFCLTVGNQSCIDDDNDDAPSDEGQEIHHTDSSTVVSELSESPPLGATFDHPAAALKLQKSSSSEGGPLGIPCGHPNWNRRKDDECYGGSAVARVRQQSGKKQELERREQQGVWSRVKAPPMDGDGNMTDHPPSPIKAIRTKPWDVSLHFSDSEDSEITMSDVFCAGSVEQVAKVDALKVLRTRVTLAGASPVPFDEAVADGHRKRPFPRTTPHVPGLKPRPTMRSPPPRSKSLSSFLMDALYHNEENEDVVDGPDEEVELYTSSTSRSSSPMAPRLPPKCHCVKCAARFVYQDLLSCAVPTATRRRASSPQLFSKTAAYI